MELVYVAGDKNRYASVFCSGVNVNVGNPTFLLVPVCVHAYRQQLIRLTPASARVLGKPVVVLNGTFYGSTVHFYTARRHGPLETSVAVLSIASA